VQAINELRMMIVILPLYIKNPDRRKEAFSILNNSIQRDENSLKSTVNAWMFKLIKLRLASAYDILDEKASLLAQVSKMEQRGEIDL
jgi:hypothetical protein